MRKALLFLLTFEPDLALGLAFVIFLTFSLLTSACSTPLHDLGPLAQQRLVARPGHVGKLTSQTCKDRSGDECLQWHVLEYDLQDPAERVRLRDANIVCRVSGELFYPCVEKPGLCTQTRKVTKRFLGIPVKRELVVTGFIHAVDGYQRLLDSGAVCRAQVGGP